MTSWCRTGSRAALVLVLRSTLLFSGGLAAQAQAGSRGIDPALPPEPESLVIVSEMRPKGRGNYLDLVRREAERQGLPPDLADAVVHVESGYDPTAVGGVGEVGLMQIRPSTATMLGFDGPVSRLFDPETNVRYGVAYLAGAWRLAAGDACMALVKYRAGHGERRVSPRSAAYCARANAFLALPSRATVSSFRPAMIPSTRAQSRGPSLSAKTLTLWAAHVARVRQIETRISRVMAGS